MRPLPLLLIAIMALARASTRVAFAYHNSRPLQCRNRYSVRAMASSGNPKLDKDTPEDVWRKLLTAEEVRELLLRELWWQDHQPVRTLRL